MKEAYFAGESLGTFASEALAKAAEQGAKAAVALVLKAQRATAPPVPKYMLPPVKMKVEVGIKKDRVGVYHVSIAGRKATAATLTDAQNAKATLIAMESMTPQQKFEAAKLVITEDS